ncbi:MAG: hypothetical protein MZU95_04295 [Desulfomicrobium escambiense]|nr:hypothetical protein [Desulfomicrobium escambiense]
MKNGFYYDFDIPDHNLSSEDIPAIEQEMSRIIKLDEVFERTVIKNVQEQATDFREKGEIYKLELLMEFAQEEPTMYICKSREDGKILWSDLCRGPHIPSTKFIKAFKILSVAGAYWRGNEKNKMLQRVYGTAFWTKDELQEYLTRLEEAENATTENWELS